MENSDFDKLLERYLLGQVSESEKKRIEAWLDLHKSGNTNLQLSVAEEAAIYKKITGEQEPVFTKSRTLPSQTVLRIAAGFVLLISVLSTVYLLSRSRVNEGQKMTLADGTIVWLEENSTLTYAENETTKTRQASLTGSGLFEVAKDPSRPFVIQWKQITLKVVGTSFFLNTSGDTLKLSVLTGKVNLTNPLTHTSLDVTPSQVAHVTNSFVILDSLTNNQVKQMVNPEYQLAFENSSLREVATRLEKKFDVDIKFDNAALAKCRITADFTDQSLTTSLNWITEILPVQYQIKNEQITLTGNCN